MPARPFLVVAHRGSSADAPENTFSAFDAAIKEGADAIEFDVRLTKDNVAVLSHDASLQRTAGKEVLIRDLSLEELKKVDVGSYKSGRFKSARVPTLTEVVQNYLPKLRIEIELKESGTELPTVQLLQQANDLGVFNQVLVTSFERKFLVSVRMLDSRVQFGYLLEPSSQDTLAEVKHLGATWVIPFWEEINKTYVDDAHQLGLQVRAWGVKTLDAAKRVIAAGADGLTYDRPTEVIAYLKESGIRTNGHSA